MVFSLHLVAIRFEDFDGKISDQIVLNISISDSVSSYSRFWENETSNTGQDEKIDDIGKCTVEFCLNPRDIIKALKSSDFDCKNEEHTKINSRQQLIELLTGLRTYAEVISQSLIIFFSIQIKICYEKIFNGYQFVVRLIICLIVN